MSGKLCTGFTLPHTGGAAVLKQSHSFCEGLHYRAGGTEAERPLTDNPHLANFPAYISWLAGWTLADNNKGGSVTRAECGCCAAPGDILV